MRQQDVVENPKTLLTQSSRAPGVSRYLLVLTYGAVSGCHRHLPPRAGTPLLKTQARCEGLLQKIIDAHVHLSERRDDALIRFARINSLRYTLDELLRTMRRHKISRGLLLSPPLKEAVPLLNDEVIRL